MVEKITVIMHVLTAISIVGLILLQQGKGADAGASFGSGASQTVFGAAGGGNILTQGTAWLAALFFATSLGLAIFSKQLAEEAGRVEFPSVMIDDTAPAAGDLPSGDLVPEVPAATLDQNEEIPDVSAVVREASEEVPQPSDGEIPVTQ